ncbi:hypothetical protein ACVWXP_007308 [Bradyrhizobium sp. USDA 4463]
MVPVMKVEGLGGGAPAAGVGDVSDDGRQDPPPEVQGVQIDDDAAATRASKMSLGFGAARTRLLEESVLTNWINAGIHDHPIRFAEGDLHTFVC